MMESQPLRPRLVTFGMYASVAAGVLMIAFARDVYTLVPAAMLLAIAHFIATRFRRTRAAMLAYWPVATLCDIFTQRVDDIPGTNINGAYLVILVIAYHYLYNRPEVAAWFDTFEPPPHIEPGGVLPESSARRYSSARSASAQSPRWRAVS